ncbi:transcriptional regulator [Sphaerisporangium siamense]|nr:transcriptional regulator [Sphaerisporangium siamense]
MPSELGLGKPNLRDGLHSGGVPPKLCGGKELRHTDVVKNMAGMTNAEKGAERGTRARVARLILEHGPVDAAALGERLGLTPAAVRRHLDALVAEGMIEPRTARPRGQRGRGRPAKLFIITDAGRSAFEHAYDGLAGSALRFLAEHMGEDAVARFARSQVSGLVRRLEPQMREVPAEQRVRVLAEALTADGYAASASTAKSGGEQLCQHHCPVAHVAAEFPQLCEAETEAFGQLLGTPVQRLATIAHGDGVCTTHVSPRVLAAQRPPRHGDADPDDGNSRNAIEKNKETGR